MQLVELCWTLIPRKCHENNSLAIMQVMTTSGEKTAVLLGASGLVGGDCLRALLADPRYARVLVLNRRELALPQDPKLAQRVVTFENLTAVDFQGTDDVFCALGTTIKKAGSQEAFRHVDFDYPLAAARAARNAGAKQFALVSSVGADPASGNFYLRTKGDLEEAIQKLGFNAVHLFRPSLLLGHRAEFRAGERVAIAIAPLFSSLMMGGLRRYRPIQASTVGAAMVQATAKP